MATQQRKPILACAVHDCRKLGLYRVVRRFQIGKSATSIAFYYYCAEHNPEPRKATQSA